MIHNSRKGFTLIEILVYAGIFAVVAGLMTGIMLTTTQVGEQQKASAEVTGQLNFVLQTIQNTVRDSSNIEIEAGVATSTLKLRMKDSAKDPTYISLSDNAVQFKEGSNATTTLTNDKVVVNTLSFKKFTQYPGHDVVSVDITMAYNTSNPKSQMARTLSSAIARVSAATFDSDVVPGGTYNYDLGQTGSPWRKIIMADGTAANPSYTFGSNTGLGLFRGGSNILGFTTAGSERMRIDASGNVGIGTTAPDATLDIAASAPMIRLQQSGSTQAKLKFMRSGATRWDLYNDAADSDKLKIWGYGAITPLTIDTSGNVGIATTTPSAAFHIDVPSIVPIKFRRAAGGGTGQFDIDNKMFGSGGDMMYTPIPDPGNGGGHAFYVNTGSATNFAMGITKEGKVGIGTTSPASKLQIMGSSLDDPVLKVSGPTHDMVVLGDRSSATDDAGFLSIKSAAGITVIDLPGNSDNVYFKNGGNFGIGTSEPNEKLEVSGAIKAIGNRFYGASGHNIRLRTVTVANNANEQLLHVAGGGDDSLGIVFVSNSAAGQTAIYAVNSGNATVYELADGSGAFTPTAGNAGTTNIYFKGDPRWRYEIENKTGGSATYYITEIVGG